MAQIKMDVSEYETLKENKKLLEQALEQQKNDSITITALQKEKVDVMKKNEKMVTIKKVVDHVQRPISIIPARELWQKLQQLMGIKQTNYNSAARSYGFGGHHDMAHQIVSSFIKTDQEVLMYSDENVTYKGLDQVKEEIKKEYEAQLSAATKRTLDDFKAVSKDNKELTEKVAELTDMNTSCFSSIEANLKKIDKLEKTIATLKDANEKLYNVTRRFKEVTIWNLSEFKRSLTETKQGRSKLFEWNLSDPDMEI